MSDDAYDPSLPDQFYDWKVGDTALKGWKVASTLRYLRSLVQAGVALLDVVQSADRRTIQFETAAGLLPTAVRLPAGPWAWRIDGRVVGSTYYEGDVFYVPDTRSSYVALIEHVAGADLDLDLAAHKIALTAKGGRDAVTFRGDWNTVLNYGAGDVVTVKLDANNPLVVDAYEAFADVPANTDPRLGYPWGKLTARPGRGIEKELSAKPLAGQVLRSIVNGAITGGIYIPKGASGSYAAFGAAPAAAYTVTVNRRAGGPGGTSTNIGTITWAANATQGTFNIAAGFVVAAGDVVEFVFPSTQDSAAAVLCLNLAVY